MLLQPRVTPSTKEKKTTSMIDTATAGFPQPPPLNTTTPGNAYAALTPHRAPAPRYEKKEPFMLATTVPPPTTVINITRPERWSS
jgi:hypothetical protein